MSDKKSIKQENEKSDSVEKVMLNNSVNNDEKSVSDKNSLQDIDEKICISQPIKKEEEATIKTDIDNNSKNGIENVKITPFYKRKGFIIAMAIVLVLVVILIGFLTYFSPGNVAKRFALIEIENDVKKASNYWAYNVKLIPFEYEDEEEFFEYLSDEYKDDISSWDDYYRCIHEATLDELEDIFYSYEITAEVANVKEISLKKLEYIVNTDFLERQYGFDKDNISSYREVIVKLKIKGESKTERYTYSIFLGRQNGFWKVISYNVDEKYDNNNNGFFNE